MRDQATSEVLASGIIRGDHSSDSRSTTSNRIAFPRKSEFYFLVPSVLN